MRVTGGSMRGQQIRVPRVAVRPTQDRVREALFSALQTIIPDAHVLDLFAGSGALGIESLSRGAASVTWVEEDRRVFPILRKNVETICGMGIAPSARRCVRADVFSFLRKGLAGHKFDVIFADPPYQKGERAVAIAAADRLLTAVAASGLLAPGGIFALEQDAGEPEPESTVWELIRDKRYGGSRLRFFKAKGG
jgi:16S rRNA (guanine966-N2)-methyltransferase